jgi:tRNA nucleotidyltransferase/poly(A) polymerase
LISFLFSDDDIIYNKNMTPFDKRISDYIPDSIISVLQLIENKGFDVFIVGGAVRDLLLSRRPLEYDLATNARPEDIQHIFDHTTPLGIEYGSIRVHFRGQVIEVTTFRSESNYNNSRHPDHVDFVRSIETDVARRDFTMNAMAYNPLNDTFIDCYDGQKHLNDRLLVCVGDPGVRFKEDTLRVYRCFRFLAQLGFVVDHSIITILPSITSEPAPSVERIRNEMDRLLLGPFWQSALKLMQETGWLAYLLKASVDLKLESIEDDLLYRWAWLLSKGSFDDLANWFQFSKKDQRSMMEIIEWSYNKVALDITLKDLNISSIELQALGYEGRALGQIQAHLLNQVRLEKINNHLPALLQFAKDYLH